MTAKEFQELWPILLAAASAATALVAFFIFYQTVSYIFISLQLQRVAQYSGKRYFAWMAWLPGFRQFMMFMVSGKPQWFLLWLFLFLPAQLGITYLFLENIYDLTQTSIDISELDIVGFITEMTFEDYWEAYMLSFLVAIRTAVLVIMYHSLSIACNRSPIWLLVVIFIPLLNLIPYYLYATGMKKKQQSTPTFNRKVCRQNI